MHEHLDADELATLHSSVALNESQIVKGEIVGKAIYMTSPYNPDLIDRIRTLKPRVGKWDALKKRWSFPLDRLDDIKAMFKAVYGEDGFAKSAMATVVVDLDKARTSGIEIISKGKSIWFMGKSLARTFRVDRAPRVDSDVIVHQGGFVSTGSANLPEVAAKLGTIITVSNVPLELLLKAVGSRGREMGVDIKNIDQPNGAPALSTQNVAAAPSSTSSTGTSSVTSSSDAGGQSSSAPAVPITYDMADKSTKMAYLSMQLMVKALATRAAQLPDDVVNGLLAQAGLKRAK